MRWIGRWGGKRISRRGNKHSLKRSLHPRQPDGDRHERCGPGHEPVRIA
jgi:hypothetical protein